MKKFMTVAACAALAFAACGDSSSDSVPTTGNPQDALFGSPWVSTSAEGDTQSEVLKFERTGVNNFAKLTKYLTCDQYRFSIVETEVQIGDRALTVPEDVSGPDNDGCQASFKKDNYTYTVTQSTLAMASTSGEKKTLNYTRKGLYSCEFQNYLEAGHACADYYNDTVSSDACVKQGGVLNMTRSCADRVTKAHKQICRYDRVSSGKNYNFVLTFYDEEVDCGKFRLPLLESLLD